MLLEPKEAHGVVHEDIGVQHKDLLGTRGAFFLVLGRTLRGHGPVFPGACRGRWGALAGQRRCRRGRGDDSGGRAGRATRQAGGSRRPLGVGNLLNGLDRFFGAGGLGQNGLVEF